MHRALTTSIAAGAAALLIFAAAPSVAIAESAAPAGKKKVIKVVTPATDALSYEGMPKKLKAGTYVFKYTNNSTMGHDLKVGKKKTPIITSGTTKIKVKLTKGKVKYKCTVSGHAQAGMKGKITVTG
ncbi:MAG: hypothetical protein K0U60_01115 [Actinomycetia bacterium]|nr:hypothetical protein [Actinomycetes bacterium]